MTIEDVDNVQQTHHSTLPALFLIFTTVFLLFLAARSPLERNQEARVLETAREMLHAPLIQWAVPRINGEIRVNKPPLAYWLSACSMKIFGETPFAGRVPFVFVVTATLWMIYRLGAREFSRATGQMAMWMTLGTTLYASYGILAETDAISVLVCDSGDMGDQPQRRERGIGGAGFESGDCRSDGGACGDGQGAAGVFHTGLHDHPGDCRTTMAAVGVAVAEPGCRDGGDRRAVVG